MKNVKACKRHHTLSWCARCPIVWGLLHITAHVLHF